MAARVSRHRVTREPQRSDDSVCLFNPLPSAASSPSSSLPASFLKRRHREEGKAKAQGKGEEGGALNRTSHCRRSSSMAGDKRPRDEESSAKPRGLRRAHREFFRGRYLSALSSFFYPCILF